MGSVLVGAQGEGGVATSKDKTSGVWPRLKAGLLRLGPSNHHRRAQQPSAEAQPLKVIDQELNGVIYKDIGIGKDYVPRQYYSSSWPYKGLTIAALLTALSLTLTSIMWLTNIYGNAILKLVSIRNDIDMVFEMWRVPPAKPTLSVYIFNYTNHKKVLEGKEKPRVTEVGPYVFNEKLERINVKFNPNGTVSFQENRTIVANPELSRGRMDDTVIVPNVPVITVLKSVNRLFYLEHHIYSKIIESVNVQLFQNLTVNDFIWGHEDAFFKLLKSLDGNAKGFGFLANRRGVHHDVVTMHTGELDLESAGQITRWNGQEKIGCWGDTHCDQLIGSDGTMFPAKATRDGKPLYIYNHGMCRRLALHFSKTTKTVDGFPAQEYNIAHNLFDFSNKTAENSCYKYKGSYPPSGVFNTGPCQNDKPIYISFPHFWMGEEKLQQSITGLAPDENKHRSYFQIHKKLGVSLKAVTRFQLNIMLRRARYFSQTSKLQNETIILPIAWLDYDSGEFPEHFVNVMSHLTYTVTYVEEALKWLFLTCTLTSIAFFFVQVRTLGLRKV